VFVPQSPPVGGGSAPGGTSTTPAGTKVILRPDQAAVEAFKPGRVPIYAGSNPDTRYPIGYYTTE
jgi:hypothetical protein